MLRVKYPQARWNFIDAAIGGTGSMLGIYRLERDVLAYKPDLVFLDFTLNDNAKTTDDEALAAYEGILRNILTNGNCPIFPVFLASRDFVTLPDINALKRRTSHIAMFQDYNLAYADVVAGMRDDYRAGKLDLDKVWPPELFDNTHPHDHGYAVYADHVWKAFQCAALENLQPRVPAKWFSAPTYAKIQRFKLSELKRLPEGWHIGMPEIRAGTFDFLCSRWQDNEVIAANCKRLGFDQFELTGAMPEPLTVKFFGATVLIFGEATLWGGPYQISIDGHVVGTHNDANWVKTFAPSAFLVKVLAQNLNPVEIHTLTIEPEFSGPEPQMLKLESVCVGGPERAEIVPD